MLKRGIIFLVLACAASGFFACASPVSLGSFGGARAPTVGTPQLVVMTYNVNYGVAGDALTLALIEESDAHIIFLQETTPEWQAAIEERTAERFPHQVWRSPSGGWAAGGSAVLSHWPLRDVEISPSAADWFEAIGAVVESPFGDVRVAGLHLEPAASLSAALRVSSHHEDEIQAHIQALELDGDLPTIIAGDFNEERAGALRTLESMGFVDAAGDYHPGVPTFEWHLRFMTLKLQLDHVLHHGLESLSAHIVQGGRSDHQPVRAAFRFR
jgi:endonuclease/exonuclease/phosphatase family metal-dependent hydrolase